MSVLKEMSESLLKYGEMIVNKTEEYTKILKLTLDIKKQEGEIEKIEKKVGQHVIESINGGSEISAKDSIIQENLTQYQNCKETIIAKKKEIEILKDSDAEKK